MLSVVTAKLAAQDAQELYQSDLGLQAYVAAMEPLIGKIAISRAEGRITLKGERASIYVTPERISIYAGFSINRQEGERIAQAMVDIAHALALPLAQERLVQTIKARYGQLAVLTDTQRGGARATRVRIPL